MKAGRVMDKVSDTIILYKVCSLVSEGAARLS